MQPGPFPRKKRRLLIEYIDSSGERRTAFTRDFSLTGFYVLAEAMPAVGTVQEMKLHLPRGVIGIPARVVRKGRGTSAVEGSATKGFAVAISGSCEEYTKLVDTL
jgi:PilZ domain